MSARAERRGSAITARAVRTQRACRREARPGLAAIPRRSFRMCSSSCFSSRPRSPRRSGSFERDAALPYEAIAIFAVVLLNATMGYVQESRAEAAVAALRAMSAADASVIRGGERRSVPASQIVPGRHHPHRGRRHHCRRRPADRVRRPADGRSRTDRREPAGHEGYRRDRRRRAARRSRQHGLQRHGRDLRAREGGRHRHRHAHRDGAHRRTAQGRRRTRRRRSSANSIAPARCSASSSSPSPSS